MIDPKSITIKYKNEDAVLKAYAAGASVRDAATLCNVSSKTAHNIRLKHDHLFPKKEKIFRTPKLPKKKGVKRWVTVPVEIDEKICMAARVGSKSWQDQANLIFKGWGESPSDPTLEQGEEFFIFNAGDEKFEIPVKPHLINEEFLYYVKDYLNEHGEYLAAIDENNALRYGLCSPMTFNNG